MASQAFNVYKGRKLIETVFYSGNVDADEVRRSLIDHDGHDEDIRVVKAKDSKKTPQRQAFNVYKGRKLINTVFYSGPGKVDADEVRRSLLDHDGYRSLIGYDGYDSDIRVVKAKSSKKNPRGGPYDRTDATLATGLGSLAGSVVGGAAGAVVGIPTAGMLAGSVLGGVAGGHYYAPAKSMRRTMTGGGVGGVFGPIGAAIGGNLGARKPDGPPRRRGKSKNPADSSARVRRMMNPRNY